MYALSCIKLANWHDQAAPLHKLSCIACVPSRHLRAISNCVRRYLPWYTRGRTPYWSSVDGPMKAYASQVDELGALRRWLGKFDSYHETTAAPAHSDRSRQGRYCTHVHVAQGPSDLCLLGLGQQDSVLCRQVHGPVLQRGSWSTANAECVVSSLFYCRFEKRRGWCAWFHSASMKTKKQGGCSRIREGSGEMTCAITTLFWIQGDGLTWSTFEGR